VSSLRSCTCVLACKVPTRKIAQSGSWIGGCESLSCDVTKESVHQNSYVQRRNND
jgi:hypothetical protein